MRDRTDAVVLVGLSRRQSTALQINANFSSRGERASAVRPACTGIGPVVRRLAGLSGGDRHRLGAATANVRHRTELTLLEEAEGPRGSPPPASATIPMLAAINSGLARRQRGNVIARKAGAGRPILPWFVSPRISSGTQAGCQTWMMRKIVSQEHVRRRLEAIMFADVVGYSRLTGQDEVGTWRRLRILLRDVVRPRVRTHAGRIVRIKGDGILVEFPSAVEAVASAVALQQALAQRNASFADAQRIHLRIGINLGDVITNDQDVHGDGVNIACRLEPLAEPGGICISATVYEHVRAKLPYPFENRGEQTLKNIAVPVQIYALAPEIIAGLPKDDSRSDTSKKSWRWQVAALAVACLASAVLWLQWQHLVPARETAVVQASSPLAAIPEPGNLPSVPAQSIVVLPFTASDPEHEYFAEGITED